jgi:hypothetical protein
MTTFNELFKEAASNRKQSAYTKIVGKFAVAELSGFSVVKSSGYTAYAVREDSTGVTIPLRAGGGISHIEVRMCEEDTPWEVKGEKGVTKAGAKAFYLV